MTTASLAIHKTGNRVQKLNRIAAFGVLAGASLIVTGCRQDMHDQPKFFPQRGTDFYADGRSVRPQVENTVARSQLHEDTYFYTGMQGGKEGDGMPFPVTMAVLERGQERYNIYCTPCHSRVGNGAGMIVQRGYAKAGNFHDFRLIAAPLGHFFAVMTNGYGSMPEYAAQLTPEDRWAVAAYIRALQLSQRATRADVPAGEQVRPLSSVAESVGLTAQFANDWGLPPTAGTGTPSGLPFAIPAEALPENLPGAPKGPPVSTQEPAPATKSTGNGK